MKASDLFEAPISDFTTIGDFTSSHSFRKEIDRKLLSSPKAIQKIKDKWQKTPVDFNLYFVNHKGYGKFVETGEVDQTWINTNMKAVASDIKIDEDAINIIYTNNLGAEWMPMTAWIIAHRFGHVIARLPEFNKFITNINHTLDSILSDDYNQSEYNRNRSYRNYGGGDPKKLAFVQKIGTFRSARTGNIRNVFEFYLELIAQYITTGSVKFNPLPNSIRYGKMAWGKHSHFLQLQSNGENGNEELSTFARDLTNFFIPDLLRACIGRIFVM